MIQSNIIYLVYTVLLKCIYETPPNIGNWTVGSRRTRRTVMITAVRWELWRLLNQNIILSSVPTQQLACTSWKLESTLYNSERIWRTSVSDWRCISDRISREKLQVMAKPPSVIGTCWNAYLHSHLPTYTHTYTLYQYQYMYQLSASHHKL